MVVSGPVESSSIISPFDMDPFPMIDEADEAQGSQNDQEDQRSYSKNHKSFPERATTSIDEIRKLGDGNFGWFRHFRKDLLRVIGIIFSHINGCGCSGETWSIKIWSVFFP
jgi:hypothetical protein